MNTPSTSIAVILGGLYLITNLICLAAYLPQIRRVWNSAEARAEVVLVMWWVWTWGGLTEWAYAVWVADSLTWQAVAVCHTVACLAVAVPASLERLRRPVAPVSA